MGSDSPNVPLLGVKFTALLFCVVVDGGVLGCYSCRVLSSQHRKAISSGPLLLTL